MKIAITAQGNDLASKADPHFGRARYFIVVDTETKEFSAHDNTQNLNAVQGAGIQAGRTVVDLGVEAVVTGTVGPKAYATLRAGNIPIYPGATGTVLETLAAFNVGQLQPTNKANVEGHWA